MVRFKKNKLKTLNKLTKKLNDSPSNKVLKKKLNAEKKVTFQKEKLLKETLKSGSLVKVKSKLDIVKKEETCKSTPSNTAKPKQKSVEKKKKRQKTQVDDTKLVLSIMRKKFSEMK